MNFTHTQVQVANSVPELRTASTRSGRIILQKRGGNLLRPDLIIIGGGLAGCEAAWQAAERGIQVELYEMRPEIGTGAHTGGGLAELVCSNSLGSNLPDRAPGLLKNELRMLGSMLIACADACAVPAGGALAVDRDLFSQQVTEKITTHPRINLIRKEMRSLPEEIPVIVASGPLTSTTLSQAISELTGKEHLYFFDAIAPVIFSESINLAKVFRGSRYGRGEQVDGDYLNCPLDRNEYERFIKALITAERIELKSFEEEVELGVRAGMHAFFEGCLPVEILARRGEKALAFGPLRPVGLSYPQQDSRPFAVVQLRQDNLAGSLYNMVGFQTNLTFSEQRRVFHMIPGLENAEFARYGQMHRNTFIFSPAVLQPTLQFRSRRDLFFAGQITGVEGYAGNIGTGLIAGLNASRLIQSLAPVALPNTTMLGALCNYITQAQPADFQPMKANYGILPALALGTRVGKRERAAAYSERAIEQLRDFLTTNSLITESLKNDFTSQ